MVQPRTPNMIFFHIYSKLGHRWDHQGGPKIFSIIFTEITLKMVELVNSRTLWVHYYPIYEWIAKNQFFLIYSYIEIMGPGGGTRWGATSFLTAPRERALKIRQTAFCQRSNSKIGEMWYMLISILLNRYLIFLNKF